MKTLLTLIWIIVITSFIGMFVAFCTNHIVLAILVLPMTFVFGIVAGIELESEIAKREGK